MPGKCAPHPNIQVGLRDAGNVLSFTVIQPGIRRGGQPVQIPSLNTWLQIILPNEWIWGCSTTAFETYTKVLVKQRSDDVRSVNGCWVVLDGPPVLIIQALVSHVVWSAIPNDIQMRFRVPLGMAVTSKTTAAHSNHLFDSAFVRYSPTVIFGPLVLTSW